MARLLRHVLLAASIACLAQRAASQPPALPNADVALTSTAAFSGGAGEHRVSVGLPSGGVQCGAVSRFSAVVQNAAGDSLQLQVGSTLAPGCGNTTDASLPSGSFYKTVALQAFGGGAPSMAWAQATMADLPFTAEGAEYGGACVWLNCLAPGAGGGCTANMTVEVLVPSTPDCVGGSSSGLSTLQLPLGQDLDTGLSCSADLDGGRPAVRQSDGPNFEVYAQCLDAAVCIQASSTPSPSPSVSPSAPPSSTPTPTTPSRTPRAFQSAPAFAGPAGLGVAFGLTAAFVGVPVLLVLYVFCRGERQDAARTRLMERPEQGGGSPGEGGEGEGATAGSATAASSYGSSASTAAAAQA